MTLKLSTKSRKAYNIPVDLAGDPLPTLLEVAVSIDEGEWKELIENFDHPLATSTKRWFRMLLAGPDVDIADDDISAHPGETIVILEESTLEVRAVAGQEVLAKFMTWIRLV